MSDAQRVIDDIDALVDEQIAAGEAPGGYDYNDPEFPRCRCGCMWHGLRKGGCPGSGVEGPLMATGLRFGNWASEMVIRPRRLGHFDPAVHLAAAQQWLVSNWGPLGGIAPRGVHVGGRVFGRPNLERIFISGRSGLVYEMFAERPTRCTLAARRRMHSDQLRVQRRAVRRERRARRREVKYDHPLEVHDDHVVLTLTPDISGFRRELLEDV